MREEKEKLVEQELEIEDMQKFLLENQDIKLENLPRYEDMIAPTTVNDVKLDDLQEVNNLPFFDAKVKKEQPVETKNTHRTRFKVITSCFAIVGVLILSLVLVNGLSLALLANETKDNQKDITTLTQEVEDLEERYAELDQGEAEGIRYKLALPRNYPDDTSELTWIDKLSIFLMKLFG